MPFTIVRNDITRMWVDAVVNSTAPGHANCGGADGAIHRAAGPELEAACRAQGGVKPGRPLLTPGFRLPCRYVIHTVAPMWQGGGAGEERELYACYTDAMAMAVRRGLETLAFPLMSSGLFGFPRERALLAATDAIRDFVLTHDLMVYLVVYDSESFAIGEKLQADIRQYIDDRYVQEHREDRLPPPMPQFARQEEWLSVEYLMPVEAVPEPEDHGKTDNLFAGRDGSKAANDDVCDEETFERCAPLGSDNWEEDLRSLLEEPDESFSQQLLRRIDESGMTDPECYRRANIDRRLFSKIRSNPGYRPSKQTALAFAVALRLSLPETDRLLRTAGLALSRSSYFDLIVAFFIERGIFDVLRINEVLYAYDQPLLGN